MKVLARTIPEPPSDLLKEYVCVWVFLKDNASPPLRGRLSSWLDWKLQGILSNYRASEQSQIPTFIPMMRKVGFPFLAIQKHALDIPLFKKNCEGQKWERVLLVCESNERLMSLGQELAEVPSSFPTQVDLVVDS